MKDEFKLEVKWDAQMGVVPRNTQRPKAQNTYKKATVEQSEEEPSGWNWVILVGFFLMLFYWLFN